ncbi:MAG: hypothetical protein AAGG56_00440 [Pseudomonadota bacterium]
MATLLEIAISLILIFLVLSLVVTAINELLSIILAKRSKMLFNTIEKIIDDDAFRKRFYESGLIKNIAWSSKAGNEKAFVNGKITDKSHPSYISSAQFAKAVTMALVDSKISAGFGDVVQKIEGHTLPHDSKFRDVLISATMGTQKDIASFETAVAKWFDSAQDRLTGAYARYQKWVSLVVGLILVVALNVDAVRIAQQLQVDEELRLALVQNADDVVNDGIADRCADVIDPDEKRDCITQQIEGWTDTLAPLPLGWKDDELRTHPFGGSDAQDAAGANGVGNFLLLIVYKILGLLITATAITLGAPFWFDLLSKFVNIRSAGAKPDASAKPNSGASGTQNA